MIYRIENNTGIGPYSVLGDGWTEEPHFVETGRPHPILDDGPLKTFWCTQEFSMKLDYLFFKFGFSTISQLTRWFTTNELFKLNELGFSVAVYNSDTVYESSKQCAFKDGKLIERMNILDFLEDITAP